MIVHASGLGRHVNPLGAKRVISGATEDSIVTCDLLAGENE